MFILRFRGVSGRWPNVYTRTLCFDDYRPQVACTLPWFTLIMADNCISSSGPIEPVPTGPRRSSRVNIGRLTLINSLMALKGPEEGPSRARSRSGRDNGDNGGAPREGPIRPPVESPFIFENVALRESVNDHSVIESDNGGSVIESVNDESVIESDNGVSVIESVNGGSVMESDRFPDGTESPELNLQGPYRTALHASDLLTDISPCELGQLVFVSNSISFIPEKLIRRLRLLWIKYMQYALDSDTTAAWKKYFLLPLVLFDASGAEGSKFSGWNGTTSRI